MTEKQLHRLTERAYRAAKAFRSAAIDADSAIQAYSAHKNTAARRLRELAELATSHALDTVLESGQNMKKSNEQTKT